MEAFNKLRAVLSPFLSDEMAWEMNLVDLGITEMELDIQQEGEYVNSLHDEIADLEYSLHEVESSLVESRVEIERLRGMLDSLGGDD